MKCQVLGTSLFIDVKEEDIKVYLDKDMNFSISEYLTLKRDEAINYLNKYHSEVFTDEYQHNFKTMLTENQYVELSILEG
jgi:hypothetical protein